MSNRSLVCSAKTLFDVYIFVDWGSKNGPYGGKNRSDSPWLAEARWQDGSLQWEPESWFKTRRTLIEHARRRLYLHRDAGRRVLVGFDFSYGYPAGFGRALRLADPTWRGVWEEMRRPSALPGDPPAPTNDSATPDNRNNRFAVAAHLNRRIGAGTGPLFGGPRQETNPWFGQRSPGFPFRAGPDVALAEYRLTERHIRANGGSPLSGWWVLGGMAPTVGGQILTGIPSVYELRYDPVLAEHSRVWPFETGFTACPTQRDLPAIVHAEIWPGLQAHRVESLQRADPSLVRDQAQVRAMVVWAAEEDAADRLGQWFDVPPSLNENERRICETEEGWILGA